MRYRLTQYRVALVRTSAKLIEGPKCIESVAHIVEAVSDMRRLDREQLRVLYLNTRNGIIGWEMISQGSLTGSFADPREIFKGAILASASAIVLVHNHPSGDPRPSDEDIRLTKRITDAGQILGIQVMDHIILAEHGCYSFKTLHVYMTPQSRRKHSYPPVKNVESILTSTAR